MNNRPSWNDYFMEIAYVVSKRSTCIRRQVGAVVVKDRRILATGYNGAPTGVKHCDKTGCLRQELKIPSGERHEICRAVHAEQNAITQAALHGVSVNGADMYVTVTPCFICGKIIVNAGIKKVYIDGDYPDDKTLELFEEAGVVIEKLNHKESR